MPSPLSHDYELRLLGGSGCWARRALDVPLSARRLLAFLAVNHRSMTRTFVAGTLWPDTTDVKAAANLRTALWRLHELPEPAVVASSRRASMSDEIDVDVHRLVAIAELAPARWRDRSDGRRRDDAGGRAAPRPVGRLARVRAGAPPPDQPPCPRGAQPAPVVVAPPRARHPRRHRGGAGRSAAGDANRVLVEAHLGRATSPRQFATSTGSATCCDASWASSPTRRSLASWTRAVVPGRRGDVRVTRRGAHSAHGTGPGPHGRLVRRRRQRHRPVDAAGVDDLGGRRRPAGGRDPGSIEAAAISRAVVHRSRGPSHEDAARCRTRSWWSSAVTGSSPPESAGAKRRRAAAAAHRRGCPEVDLGPRQFGPRGSRPVARSCRSSGPRGSNPPRPRSPSSPPPTIRLPRADVLVVTWTAAEWRALADVLTPGVDGPRAGTATPAASSRTCRRSATARRRAAVPPARRVLPDPHRLATVLCFKSELHLNQDGIRTGDGTATLPVEDCSASSSPRSSRSW